MPQTPDRTPGPLDEEAIDFEDTGTAPTLIGRVQRNGAQLLFKKDAGAPVDLAASGGGSDLKDLKVSGDDTTAGFLEDKFVAGNALDAKVLNEAGNEQLEVSVGFRRQFLLMGG